MKKSSKLILKLLKKQKKDKSYKKTKKTGIIYHFCNFVGMKTVEYQLPNCLNEIMNRMDKELEYFFSQSNPDEWNGEAFDKMIDSIVDLAIEDVYQQRLKHKSAAIEIRELQNAYLSKLNREIEELNKKIEEIEKDV